MRGVRAAVAANRDCGTIRLCANVVSWPSIGVPAMNNLTCQSCNRQGGLCPGGLTPGGAQCMYCIYCQQYRNYYSVQPVEIYAGQMVARPKKNGIGTHYGVALGKGIFFHNDPEHGAHFSDFDSFAAGRAVEPASQAPATQAGYQQILRNAQAL